MRLLRTHNQEFWLIPAALSSFLGIRSFLRRKSDHSAAYLRPRSTHPPVGNPFRCGRRHAASSLIFDPSFLNSGTYFCEESRMKNSQSFIFLKIFSKWEETGLKGSLNKKKE